jgi:hypothetical protein
MGRRRKKFFLPPLGLGGMVRRALSSERSITQENLVAAPDFSMRGAITVNSPAGCGVAFIARGICPQYPSCLRRYGPDGSPR